MRHIARVLSASGRRLAYLVLVGAAGLSLTIPVRSQAPLPVPGQNINMLGGLGADPFLQKQNEPSVAFSPRLSPARGANDYRRRSASRTVGGACCSYRTMYGPRVSTSA